MPFHTWNDEWFQKYGADLNKAIDECCDLRSRWGRIGVALAKEKWGRFRDNPQFYSGYWPLHELVNPGYAFYQWPRWLMLVELRLGAVIQWTRIPDWVRTYQYWVYNWSLQRVCKKYPAIIDELVADADYPDLIKGRVDGRNWRTHGDI